MINGVEELTVQTASRITNLGCDMIFVGMVIFIVFVVLFCMCNDYYYVAGTIITGLFAVFGLVLIALGFFNDEHYTTYIVRVDKEICSKEEFYDTFDIKEDLGNGIYEVYYKDNKVVEEDSDNWD